METHYLDIETTGLDPYRDQILTIQSHRIVDGRPVGDTVVLKAWESSEADIVRTFLEETAFWTESWRFVPVGFNLPYELKWLFVKGKEHGVLRRFTRFEALDKPRIDLKDVAVLLNGGRLKGARLENFSPKMGSGDLVVKAIQAGDHASIEAYIRQETHAFLELYTALLEEMPRFWRDRLSRRIGVDPDDPAPYRRAHDPVQALQDALGVVR